jgi:hypothetical protein
MKLKPDGCLDEELSLSLATQIRGIEGSQGVFIHRMKVDLGAKKVPLQLPSALTLTNRRLPPFNSSQRTTHICTSLIFDTQILAQTDSSTRRLSWTRSDLVPDWIHVVLKSTHLGLVSPRRPARQFKVLLHMLGYLSYYFKSPSMHLAPAEARCIRHISITHSIIVPLVPCFYLSPHLITGGYRQAIVGLLVCWRVPV